MVLQLLYALQDGSSGHVAYGSFRFETEPRMYTQISLIRWARVALEIIETLAFTRLARFLLHIHHAYKYLADLILDLSHNALQGLTPLTPVEPSSVFLQVRRWLPVARVPVVPVLSLSAPPERRSLRRCLLNATSLRATPGAYGLHK